MLEFAPLPAATSNRTLKRTLKNKGKRTLKEKEATNERLEKELLEDLAATNGAARIYFPPGRKGNSKNPNASLMFDFVDNHFLNRDSNREAVAIVEAWRPAPWKGQIWQAHRNIDRVWTGPIHHDLQWNGGEWVIYDALSPAYPFASLDTIFDFPCMPEASGELTDDLHEYLEDEEDLDTDEQDIAAEEELNGAYLEYEANPIGQRDSWFVTLSAFARSPKRINQVNRMFKSLPEIYLTTEEVFTEFVIDLCNRIERGQYTHEGKMYEWIGSIWGRFFFPGIKTKVYGYTDRNTYVDMLDPDLEDYEFQNHAVGLLQVEDEQAAREQVGYQLPVSRDAIFRQLNPPAQALVKMLAEGMTRSEIEVNLKLSPSQLRRRLENAVEEGKTLHDAALGTLQGCADETAHQSGVVLWPIQDEEDKLSRWLRESRSLTTCAVVTRSDASTVPNDGEFGLSIHACADESSDKFLTADEAATYLGGLNSRTVTRWAREGYIPAIPIGEGKRRLWRFLRTDLESWMLARRQGGQNAA